MPNGLNPPMHDPTATTKEPAAERILVQTKTSLVPGDEYHERCRLMRNLICQHRWQRDFDFCRDRWYEYRAQFAYENRKCYFIIDTGQSAGQTEVPIVWWEWDGKVFTGIARSLSPAIIQKLKQFPFNGLSPQRRAAQTAQPLEVTDATRREMIRARLRMNMKIPDGEKDFLRTHPEQVRILRQDLAPNLLRRLEQLCGDNEDGGQHGPQTVV